MTSWATITLGINRDSKKFTGPPTGLLIDKGNDEYGELDDGRVYALSYGRYQDKRYHAHVHDFSSSWFSGVEVAVVCSVENTGDTINATIYYSNQSVTDERADGMHPTDWMDGKRWPKDERDAFIERVEDEYGIEPVVEPIETTTPPDFVGVVRE